MKRRASQLFKALCIPEKVPPSLARSPLFVGPRKKKTTVIRNQLSLENLPVRAFDSRARGVQHFPGTSTIELPSALTESTSTYSLDRQGFPRRQTVPLPLAYVSAENSNQLLLL